MPVLLKLKVPAGPITPFLGVGPEFNYRIASYDSNPGSTFGTKKLDIGLQIAGGLEFPLVPALTTYLKVAYSKGLTDISDNAGNPLYSGVEIKTKAWLFTLGVGLPI